MLRCWRLSATRPSAELRRAPSRHRGWLRSRPVPDIRRKASTRRMADGTDAETRRRLPLGWNSTPEGVVYVHQRSRVSVEETPSRATVPDAEIRRVVITSSGATSPPHAAPGCGRRRRRTHRSLAARCSACHAPGVHELAVPPGIGAIPPPGTARLRVARKWRCVRDRTDPWLPAGSWKCCERTIATREGRSAVL